MTSERKQEFTLRITQANPTELTVILYEIAVLYTKEAMEKDPIAEKAEYRDAIRKTRNCVQELFSTLNFEYEISGKLLSLYMYVNRELIRADIRKKREPLENVITILQKLHDAYESISDQDQTAPIMENTQAVYAGLTYGRTTLNENLSNQGTNRGFLV
ncbi:MAG: flagellar protein FliS [Lachnospiraceae bacterium]|nr:flagellar protein FliS [Lachnospiraceae bacterium]